MLRAQGHPRNMGVRMRCASEQGLCSSTDPKNEAPLWYCRFKEDRHLLDLAGRGTQASAGIREARPEDDL